MNIKLIKSDKSLVITIPNNIKLLINNFECILPN